MKIKRRIIMGYAEFQKNIEEKLIKFKEELQFLPSNNPKRKWQYFDISDNLYPPIKHSFLQYAYDNSVPFHDYVNHVRSSQIFGINLFYPLLTDENNGHKILLKIFGDIADTTLKKIIKFNFEYSPDKDLLGEWPGKQKPSEYITATDILIVTQAEDDEKIIFLIEIKFTENEFSPCNGINSKGCSTENRQNCENFKNIIIENREKCYLHQKYKQRSARKYFEYFEFKRELEIVNKECPFIGNNQCIRNHALARALKSVERYKKAFFGLVYYDENKDIEIEWKNYANLFKNKDELFCIKSSDIIRNYNNTIYKLYFEKRYGLK
jgi:hypothetical protein